jgi:hypothetical protein
MKQKHSRFALVASSDDAPQELTPVVVAPGRRGIGPDPALDSETEKLPGPPTRVPVNGDRAAPKPD